jgi:hypothetical protein
MSSLALHAEAEEDLGDQGGNMPRLHRTKRFPTS